VRNGEGVQVELGNSARDWYRPGRVEGRELRYIIVFEERVMMVAGPRDVGGCSIGYVGHFR
jgi:hypothetical protein